MSTGTRSFSGHEYGREIAFAVGALIGMAVFAFGTATIVLAMSVGFRRGISLLTPTVRTVLLDRPANVAGWIGILLGSGMLLLRYSADQTASAPYMAAPGEKLVLFVAGYAMIIVGLFILRAAARIVGW